MLTKILYAAHSSCAGPLLNIALITVTLPHFQRCLQCPVSTSGYNTLNSNKLVKFKTNVEIVVSTVILFFA